MKAPLLMVVGLVCASCSQEGGAVAPQSSEGGLSEAERADALEWASEGESWTEPESVTWEEAVAGSEKMEIELDAVFKEYGFKRDERLEEHPTEAFSYTRVFTSPKLHTTAVPLIEKRLRNVSPAYVDQWGGEEWITLWLDAPYLNSNPDRDTDLLGGVGIALDGRTAFDVTGGPFVAISVFHSLVFPQFTFSFLKERDMEDQWNDGDDRWMQFFLGKQEKAELAQAVRTELIAKGYVEDTNAAPWIRFRKGKVDVIVCNSPEYKVVGSGGSRRAVPVKIEDGATSRHEWPVVLIKVADEWGPKD